VDKVRTNLGKNKGVELLGPHVFGTPLASHFPLSENFHQLRGRAQRPLSDTRACSPLILSSCLHGPCEPSVDITSEIVPLDGREAERMTVNSHPLTWRWIVSTALRILRRTGEQGGGRGGWINPVRWRKYLS
jgi:hypothetical protein